MGDTCLCELLPILLVFSFFCYWLRLFAADGKFKEAKPQDVVTFCYLWAGIFVRMFVRMFHIQENTLEVLARNDLEV